MAPVTATSTGIPRQFIDDPQLTALLERLSSYDVRRNSDSDGGNLDKSTSDKDVDGDNSNDETERVDIEGLVGELERWSQWKFQEVVSWD